jgi:hypothetical protein
LDHRKEVSPSKKTTRRQAAQKDLRGEAREKSTSGGVLYPVRWSEAIERNEAYEAFSAACARFL